MPPPLQLFKYSLSLHVHSHPIPQTNRIHFGIRLIVQILILSQTHLPRDHPIHVKHWKGGHVQRPVLPCVLHLRLQVFQRPHIDDFGSFPLHFLYQIGDFIHTDFRFPDYIIISICRSVFRRMRDTHTSKPPPCSHPVPPARCTLPPSHSSKNLASHPLSQTPSSSHPVQTSVASP